MVPEVRPIALALGLAAALAAPLAGEVGRVVGVIDGDTYRVEIGGERRTVRLIGVDAPNAERPLRVADFYGQESLLFVSNLFKGGPALTLEADPKAAGEDRGILLRHLRLPDGKDVASELLANGCATTLGASSRFEDYRKVERQARREKKGMWDTGGYAAYNQYKIRWETSPRDFGPAGDIPPVAYRVEALGPIFTEAVFVFTTVY
jgi:endonuclease YncB( thermonuclease family)